MAEKFENINNIELEIEKEEKIKSKSPDKMPLNPTAQGWSGQAVRTFLGRALIDNDGSILSVFKEKLTVMKELFTEAKNEIQNLYDAINIETLETENKVSLVEAINELVTKLNLAVERIDSHDTDFETVNQSITTIVELLLTKVNKVEGKQLSTNDYTNEEKQQVANTPLNTNEELSKKVDKIDGKELSSNDYTNNEKQKVFNTPLNTNDELNKKVDKTDLNITIPTMENGVIKSAFLPSYVDDVIEGYLDSVKNEFYQDIEKTILINNEKGKIYVDLSTEKTYRWSGTKFSIISETLATGETENSAFRGDLGKIAYDHSQETHDKNFIGLDKVDNTSDLEKPISTATQNALNNKVDKVSGKQLSTNDYTTTEKQKLADIPTPADIITKSKYEMNADFAPTKPKHLVDKFYVDETVKGITGQNPANWITDAQLTTKLKEVTDQLNEPSFIDLTLTEPVNHITDPILDSPNEIISIQGVSKPIVKQSELDIANLKVNDTLKNEQILDNGQVRISAKVGKVTFNGSENWINYNQNVSGYYSMALDLTPFNFAILQNYVLNQSIPLVTSSTAFKDYNGIVYMYLSSTNFIYLKLPSNDTSSFKTYLQQNPLTVTYQLAVQNPKEVTLNYSTKVTVHSNLDHLNYDIIDHTNLVNSNIIVDGVIYTYLANDNDNISVIGTWRKDGTNRIALRVAKGTVQKTTINVTYQLTAPRFAITDGIADVVNPKVVSVGKNLFDADSVINVINIQSDAYKTIVDSKNCLAIKGSNKTYQKVIFSKFVANTQYTFTFSARRETSISGSAIRLHYTDGTLVNIVNPTDNTWRTYSYTSLPNKTILLLDFGWADNGSLLIDIDKSIINIGSTALPYEPYQNTQTSFNETIGSIPNTSIADEIKPLANGLFEKTVKQKTVKLWEVSNTNISLASTLTNTYQFSLVNFKSTNSLKSLIGSFINTINYVNGSDDNRHWRGNAEDTNLNMFIEKSVIDAITFASLTTTEKTLFPTFTSGLTGNALLVEQLKVYCYRNNITFKGELATYEKKIASATYLDDLVINKGSTIYLDGGTVSPVVKLQCALDISAQVSKTIGDSRINDNEHQLFKTDISNIDTRVKTIEAITDVTPYVDETNKGKSGYLSPQDKAKLNKLNEANVVQGIKLSDSTTPLNLDSNKVATIPLADKDKDGLMSKSTVSQITEHEQKISALQGTVIYRGIISTSNNDISQTILNNYIKTTLKRDALLGDTLIDNDNHEWYYDGAKWNDWGISIIGVASDNSVGIVQLGYTEDKTKIPVKIVNNRVYVDITDSAVSHALGDLSKAIIKGVKVDNATNSDNADKLDNQLPSYYASKNTVDNIINGTTKVGKSDDAETLGGQLPSYYAKEFDLFTLSNSVTNLSQDVAEDFSRLAYGDIIVGNSLKLGGQEPSHFGTKDDIQTLTTRLNKNFKQIAETTDAKNVGNSIGSTVTLNLTENAGNFSHLLIEYSTSIGSNIQTAILKCVDTGYYLPYATVLFNSSNKTFDMIGFEVGTTINNKVIFRNPYIAIGGGSSNVLAHFYILKIYGITTN